MVSDQGAVCNRKRKCKQQRKRKYEQQEGGSMPSTVTIPRDVEEGPVTTGLMMCLNNVRNLKDVTIAENSTWNIRDEVTYFIEYFVLIACTIIQHSCHGVYLNGKRIDPGKWSKLKIEDRLCFGTPTSNSPSRYVLKQSTSGISQLVEVELSGGIKKKPSEMGVTDTSETGAVNSEKEEPTRNSNGKANPDEVATSTSSIDGTRRYEMMLSMQEEFLCIICRELFVKAHSLSCSHSFCKKCINDWMKANKYCPMCRKPIEGKPVPSRAIDNAIDKLVKCLPEEAQKERSKLLKERSRIVPYSDSSDSDS